MMRLLETLLKDPAITTLLWLLNLTGSQATQKSPHKPGEQASWNDTSQNKGYLKTTTEDGGPWSIQQRTMQQADQAELNKGAQEIGPRSLEHEFLQRSTRTPKLTFSMFKDWVMIIILLNTETLNIDFKHWLNKPWNFFFIRLATLSTPFSLFP